MKTKTINICGKDVTLAYCYGTEISYKMLSDEDINDFVQEVVAALNAEPQRMPDIRKSVLLIIAAAMAFTESKGEKDCPIADKDLMYHATPDELGTALGTVIALRMEFYHVPTDEAETAKKEEKEDDPKNA